MVSNLAMHIDINIYRQRHECMAAITIVIKGTKCIATTKGAWAGSRNFEQNKSLLYRINQSWRGVNKT